MNYCCDELKKHLESQEVAISYRDFIREYSIDVRHKTSVQTIKFCPWCGCRFPDDLLQKWIEELDSLRLFDPFGEDRTKVPSEFWSENWWIKRKL
ncbi:DUF6980 family protein [Yoonia sp. 2307UL14-13]|uniref:DUF6980 family protein n=1 Tax=Yoonia sp. 2307UL14-13 TaxID=3126506 RepID=UPI004040184D